jgi:DNA processing protein
VTINDTAYPAKLRQIYDPPWLLFVKGQWPKAPIRVGVVGTRRNTNYGRQATEKIVRELVLHQATIVSGFMYGIDTIAHQQAVAAGGQTIAVLGYGFDHVGPQSHRQLYQAWLQRPDQVTFISEYPPTRQPKPGLFPLRNRIVAGLSDGVVVVEAAARSGSLITAQLAIDDGRPVCAVPGSIFSRYSQGTKELVNQGACLVSSGYQVLAELGYSLAEPAPASGQASLPAAASPQAQKILQELAASPQTAEDLLQLLQIPMRELTLQITELEILGLIQRQGGLLQLAKNDHEL